MDMKKFTVVLGITGGIAAYKTPELIRALRKRGIAVEAVLTEAAKEFVTPLTIREVSGSPVHSGLFDPIPQWDVHHIALARKADLVAVVPATANCIGKLAGGLADDLLSSVLLATSAPILMAPAMNSGMYANPAVRENIRLLRSRGIRFVGPSKGALLCGTEGEGRMSEIGEIEEAILSLLSLKDLQGRKILITAGPTQENWDPVRFLTNPSSGKMGYALARVARRRGAEVCLVSGPTDLSPAWGVETIEVRTARQMYQAVMDRYEAMDILIMAAAPTDYSPRNPKCKKYKRNGEPLVIEFEENLDIAASVGKNKGSRFLTVFAAETENLKENARTKLKVKNGDLVVANNIATDGIGFRSEANQVSLIANGEEVDLPLMGKDEVAEKILDGILSLINSGTMAGLFE